MDIVSSCKKHIIEMRIFCGDSRGSKRALLHLRSYACNILTRPQFAKITISRLRDLEKKVDVVIRNEDLLLSRYLGNRQSISTRL